MSSQRPSHDATLRRLVRDARAEKPASVDFSDLEERLLREVRRAPPTPPPRSPSTLAWLALAAAALVAVWLVGSHEPSASPEARPALVETTDLLQRDGDVMPIGTRVAAAERSVSVTHAGRANWSLSPNSSALLAAKGERIDVELERGSVLSEVVPSAKPETFVVEAAGARIAVHGTVFRVSLEGDRVRVQVREGVVAVGPRGGAPAFFLKAPASGDFASDGRSGTIDGQPPSEAEAHRHERLKLARPRAASPAPTDGTPVESTETELPNEPSINDIEAGIARVVDAVTDCFSRHTQSVDGVRITAHTALSLQIAASGAVSEVHFQPPLSPEADACAAASIAHVTFAASAQGAQVTRMLELKR